MEAFLVSTLVVALAEIGDKTQLLAFLLSARFGKSRPILLGILAATLANHALASALGVSLSSALPAHVVRPAVGLSFLAMAVWILIPDKLDDRAPKPAPLGIFGTALVAFFIAEIGDKTQVATIALSARFDAFAVIVAGTTIGMMIANAPAVLLGRRLGLPARTKWIRRAAAALCAAVGVAAFVRF